MRYGAKLAALRVIPFYRSMEDAGGSSEEDVVVVNRRPVDYVLVYERVPDGRPINEMVLKQREVYMMAMQSEGLEIDEEPVENYVFVKVFCPFERLCQEAERIHLEMALDGAVFLDQKEQYGKRRSVSELENQVRKFLDMGEDLDKYSSFPFQEQCKEWFLGRHTKDDFFRPALRCLLVHHILINIDISKLLDPSTEHAKKMGLPYLLMKGVFKDSFILHDVSVMEPIHYQPRSRRTSSVTLTDATESPTCFIPPRKVPDTRKRLAHSWIRWFHRQPLNDIRDYFGEKVAFYFAWVGLFISSLWFPAILGTAVFLFGVLSRIMSDSVNFGKSSNSTNNTSNEPVKANYYLDIIRDSSDNITTPFFALIICLWGTVFQEVWKRRQISLAYRWLVDNFDMGEPDRPQFYGTQVIRDAVTNQLRFYYPTYLRLLKYAVSFSVLLVMGCVVIISVVSVILYRIYSEVTMCAKNDTVCQLLHGTFLPAVLNTMSIMILGQIYQYLAERLTDWENHRTQSQYNDALVIKLYAFQFVNTYSSLFYTAFFRRGVFDDGFLGLGPRYADNCGTTESDTCMSLLSFQLLILMIMKPLPKCFLDVIWPWLKRMFRSYCSNQVGDTNAERKMANRHYLLREKFKPGAEDFRLGEFTEKMIQYGYLVLFAASFPLAPLLALIINIIDIRVDARRLLWWNRRPIPYREDDIGIWFKILQFINICGVISNAFLIGFTSEFGRDRPMIYKLFVVIIFEHMVFAVKFLVSLVIPDVPESINSAKRRERLLISRLISRLATSKTTKLPHQEPTSPRPNSSSDYQSEEGAGRTLNLEEREEDR